MYFVVYWSGNVPTFGGIFPTQDLAQNAYNWFVTIEGVTYVQMLICDTKSVATWGTPG